MKRLSIIRVLLNATLALLIGTLVGPAIGAPFLAVAAPIFAVGFIPFYKLDLPPAVFMALQTEVWVSDIEETLYDENPWLRMARDDGAYVTNKTVHVPQSGTPPNVERDRSSVPATPAARSDAEITYDMVEYTTDPIYVKDIDEIQVSYNKRQDVLGQHTSEIVEQAALDCLHSWGATAAAAQVRTTGTASALYNPHSTATGTRKALTLADIAAAKQILDKAKVPRSGRVMVIPPEMETSLIQDNNLVDSYAFLVAPECDRARRGSRGLRVRHHPALVRHPLRQRLAAGPQGCRSGRGRGRQRGGPVLASVVRP